MFSAVLACLSGLCLALAYPCSIGSVNGPFNTHPLFAALGWLAPALLALALNQENTRYTARRNFWLGWLHGFSAYWVMLYWITHSMVYFGHLSSLTSILVLLLLIIYLSLYPAIWAMLWSSYGKNWYAPIFAALFWALLEYIRSYFMTGFPWCNIAYSQGNWLSMCQSTELLSIYGLAALLIYLGLNLATAFKHLYKLEYQKASRFLLIACLVLGFNYGYGKWRLQTLDALSPAAGQSTGGLHVSLLQGNIPQDEKWQVGSRQHILELYRELSFAELEWADLIVWPEASYPFLLPSTVKQIAELPLPIANQGKTPFYIIGAPSSEVDKKEIMNSAFFLDPQGNVLNRYDKIHLVLYGEFVPLANWLPIKKLTQTIGNFTAGTQVVPFGFTGSDGQAWQLGPMICYEVIYPEIAADYRRKGVKLLVNITNDAWFGTTSGPYQHLNMARFRAIENRMYLVRSANTGISAVIDPRGAIRQSLALNQRGTIRADIPR